MTPHKGYYSVIQYCPDLGRFEAANIGVLLFCADCDFLKAKMASNNSRIKKFFGLEGRDRKRINAFKKSLQDRLQKEHQSIRTLDDLQQFIATRANVIQITSPLPMKVLDPERDLAELFEKLIAKPPHKEERPDLRKKLSDEFLSAGIQNKVESNVQVQFPVLGRNIEFPFGFQNGRFHLINPVRFGTADPDRSFLTACKYAAEGRSLFHHPDPQRGELKLVVVGEFRPQDKQSPTVVRRLFDENDVTLFTSKEVPKLIDEIMSTAKNVN
jgi:Protein of unknown function (DUF3037)